MDKHKKRNLKPLYLFTAIMIVCVFAIQFKSEAVSYPYLIKVNKQMNTVTVYKKNSRGQYTVPVKAMVASCGYDTPIGTFRTPAKYRWRLLMGPSYGQYSTRITGGFLFHSVWYYEQDPSTLSVSSYNLLGKTASHGCIRLTCADAKWIYDNCPIGTTVTIYSSSKPGPLGKPTAIKINNGISWDPTDLNPRNPFNKRKTTISGAKNKVVELGSRNYRNQIMQGVKAVDKAGNSITNKVRLQAKFNVRKRGRYRLTYSVTAYGTTARKTVYITVRDTTRPTVTGIPTAKKYVRSLNSTVALKGVRAKDASGYTRISVSASPAIKADRQYVVTYTIRDSSGNKLVKRAIFVLDRTAPVVQLKNVSDTEYKTTDSIHTYAFWLSKVKITDKYVGYKSITITKTLLSDGTSYKVTYTPVDKLGNKKSYSFIFSLYVEPEPEPEPELDPDEISSPGAVSM